jgi:hypothetical protein
MDVNLAILAHRRRLPKSETSFLTPSLSSVLLLMHSSKCLLKTLQSPCSMTLTQITVRRLFFSLLTLPQKVVINKVMDNGTILHLHEGPIENFFVHLLDRNGGVLDLRRSGYRLWNDTFDVNMPPNGFGDDFFFVMLKTDTYSFSLDARKVWSYGEPQIQTNAKLDDVSFYPLSFSSLHPYWGLFAI